MFKASIALVLIAFGALAYGWVANNDTILYGSIGASILAGLFLLRATMADRKAGYAPEPKAPRPERPAREPRERKTSKKSDSASPARQNRGARVDSDELTRQMELTSDAEGFADSESEGVAPFRPQRRRDRLPAAPKGAAWAEPENRYDESEFEEEDSGLAPPSYDADLEEQGYEDEPYAEPAQAQVAAADDFRSRLAAVLGSTGEQEAAPATPPPPAGVPPRSRRVAPVRPPDEEESPVEEELPPAPKRRGRKRAEPVLEPESEAELDEPEEAEPDWIRIEDVPRIPPRDPSISRPSPSDQMIHYRPRRPAVARIPEEEDVPSEAPAPERRSADPTVEAKVRPVGGKRPPAPRSSGVTRISPAEKTRAAKASRASNPDAPPPRRGRPPKPNP